MSIASGQNDQLVEDPRQSQKPIGFMDSTSSTRKHPVLHSGGLIDVDSIPWLAALTFGQQNGRSGSALLAGKSRRWQRWLKAWSSSSWQGLQHRFIFFERLQGKKWRSTQHAAKHTFWGFNTFSHTFLEQMFKKSRLNFWLLYLCHRQFLPQSLLHLSAAIAGNGNHQAFLTANVQKNQLVKSWQVCGEKPFTDYQPSISIIQTGHLRKGSKKKCPAHWSAGTARDARGQQSNHPGARQRGLIPTINQQRESESNNPQHGPKLVREAV